MGMPKETVKNLRLPAAGACGGPFDALALFTQTVEEERCGDGLAVQDATNLNLAKQFAQGNGEELNLLIVFRLSVTGHEAFGEEYLHPLAQEAGARVDAYELGPVLRLVASLLEQLSLRAGQWIFAGVEAARGNFIH